MTRTRFLVNLLALWLFCHQMQPITTSKLVKTPSNPSEDPTELFPKTHDDESHYNPSFNSETIDSFVPNTLDEYEEYADSAETPRGMRVGLLNYGNRNMTMNLSNLVVLGLGMAAAVSLFSHFDSPHAFFKKRSAEIEDEQHEDDVSRKVMDIFQYATLLNDTLSKEQSLDELRSKNLNVSEILEESLDSLCKLGILCYEDGRLDIGQPSTDHLDKIHLDSKNKQKTNEPK